MDALQVFFKRYRTTIVLGSLCAVLFGFIWLYERQTLSTTDVAERRGKLLERFVRARCEKLEVQRHGVTLTIVRQRADDEEGELGVWKLTTPVTAEADDEAVSSLLGSLEWMDDRRQFRGISASDRARMGLTHPRLRAWITVANERTEVSFGGEDARSEGVYAQLADASVAYVVGKDVFEALDHDASHFRDKALFRGGTSPRIADRLTVRVGGGPVAGAGEVLLTRSGARWSLVAPIVGFASRDGVDAVLSAVDGVRAERFVEERVRDLSRYGLDAPVLEVVAEAPPPVTSDGGPRPGFRLRIGRVCAGHSDEVYALAGDVGPVVCVTEASTQGLARSAEDLREKRVLVGEDEVIETITLTARATAGAGEARLALERDGQGWRRTDGGDSGSAAESGSAGAPGERDGGVGSPADRDAVAQWLSALRSLTPTAFERLSDAAGHDDAALLRAHGLDRPRATLTVGRGEDLGPEVFSLGAADATGAWLRRGDEPIALRVDALAQPLFEASPLRLRPLRAITEDDAAATWLAVTRGAEREEVVRDGNPARTTEPLGQTWRVTAPLALPAERAKIVGLLRVFATLRADRWVSERDDAAYGLAAPRFVVEARFRDERLGDGQTPVRTLRVGAETVGGAYARLDQGTIFVAPDAFLAELRAPLAAQDLLLTPVDAVVGLTIDRGTVHRALRREGTAWREGTRTLETADVNANVRPLLDALASLRSEPMSYAAPVIAAPRARITVERSAGEPRSLTLLVGPESVGEGPRTATLAREDLAVTFRADAALVAPLLGETPPPPPVEPDTLGPAPAPTRE